MKKNIIRITLILCLCTIAYAAWDKDKPSSSTSLRASNPEILANWSALETALSQDHEFSTGGSNTGKHTQITFDDPISTPGDVANEGVLYIKDVSAVVELHFKDESGNEIQLTSAGNRIANNVNFSATNNAGTGSVNIFSVNASDEVILPTITNLSDNVVMADAKTLTVETIIAVDATGLLLQNDTPTTLLTLTDAGGLTAGGALAMGSNKITGLADATSSGDAIHLGQYTPSAYAGEESVTFPNGLIFKQGIAGAYTAAAVDSVTFAVAFPTAVISGSVTGEDTSNNADYMTLRGLSTTQIEYSSSSDFNSVHWQAWGH